MKIFSRYLVINHERQENMKIQTHAFLIILISPFPIA